MNIGRIKKVKLREIWKHEAYDFTNWLAQEDNLEILNETLGIGLINPQTEVSVGKFSVDILAEDDNGNKAIIENQLEPTNHDHLGKLITYSSGLLAETIIWIVSKARSEHEQAINWLNENTTENANFFLIEIEAWKIGDSPPAPRFNVVAKPNDWAKTIRQSSSTNKVTDLKLKQQEFWDKLKEYGEENSKYVKSWQKALPQHWMNISIGTSKAHLAATVNTRKNRVGMDLYIDDNKELYHLLESNRDDIESQLGFSLIWAELPERKASLIGVYKEGDFKDENQENELIEWVHQQAELFTKVFKKYIK
ncbi:DUF4268 domain-containing protein [Candidatus Saccharibacteria bacterium]|nr:DUF4268 domain-containing protein [Candidatus Saccharibacteria bacterium]